MRERTSTYLEKSLLWDVSEIMMDDTWNEERERKFHPVCQSLSNIVLKIIQRSTRDDVANNRTRKKERKKKKEGKKNIYKNLIIAQGNELRDMNISDQLLLSRNTL